MKNKNSQLKIVCYHLLNDFSGSPNVLSKNVQYLLSKGYSIDLYTSFNNDGFLSDIQGANIIKQNIYYRFTKNKFARLLLFLAAQFQFFFSVFKYSFSSNIIIYINTILPFGAAVAAFLLRKRIFYHIHENPIDRSIINRICIYISLKCAAKLIFVSKYVKESFGVKEEKKSVLIYNSLTERHFLKASKAEPTFGVKFKILMVCSLRAYKGVDIFVELARHMAEHDFTLIVSATESEILNYFDRTDIPPNLLILPSQKDLDKFYSNSNLLLNLSIPDQCVETFGLTVLEAMSYGLPTIVPPIGGVTEIVNDGENGYLIDSRDMEQLVITIERLVGNEALYKTLSINARAKALRFSEKEAVRKLELLINFGFTEK